MERNCRVHCRTAKYEGRRLGINRNQYLALLVNQHHCRHTSATPHFFLIMVLTSPPPPTDTITDSTSDTAYKKARRQFLKSTRNRSKGIEEQWTPFRGAEKRFKAKFPPPDLSAVLDLVLLDDKRKTEGIDGEQKWGLAENGVEWKEVEFGESQELSGRRRKAYLLPRIPGG